MEASELLRLAAQLRQAAVEAGRPDVVAKVDDLVVLIAGEPERGGNALVRFLDGLGF